MKECLPLLLPELAKCCRISDADQMNIMSTREDDFLQDREDGKEEEEDEQDYEVERGSLNTTLRKSASYAIASFSKVFQEETF